MNIPLDELQVFDNIIRASGRDPARYEARLHPDGHVHVAGPNGSAYYPRADWIAGFSRHLDRSFFDLPSRVPPGLGNSSRAAYVRSRCA